MVDVNTFFLILMCVLGSILLVALIVLVVKLINTVDRLNVVLDDINNRIGKFDNLFHIVDFFTDNMAIVSDKIVDGLSAIIRKIFNRNSKRKEEDNNE